MTHAELIARLTAALRDRPGVRLADHELRRSAVAVLLVERAGTTWVPMIERGADAPTHSGQIALPGGGHDACDVDLIATARQEPSECWPTPTRRPAFSQQGAQATEKWLRWIEQRAADYGIDPRDIADQRDIERLLTGQDSRLRHGWRAALIGNELSRRLASSTES